MLIKLLLLFLVCAIGLMNYYFAKGFWCQEGMWSEDSAE